MSRRRPVAVKFASFIELTNDENELVELFNQTESLVAQAEYEMTLRQTERTLIKMKLKKIRSEALQIGVTDHAVVRYLERVVGIDIEACKKEILSKLPKDLKLNEPVFVTLSDSDNLRYVIRDNLIISVTPIASKSTTKGDTKKVHNKKTD